ncbi:glycosyltransferase family 2 protein [Alicyclobacillus mengziensis]|nr:glycosyltransferase [Alicyclobacillus mengziensis]
MRVSVVIPTFQRPNRLVRCLRGISNQHQLPDEVIVVCRSTDFPSIRTVNDWRTDSVVCSRLLLVDKPGQIAALKTGLAAVTGEVVVFTDDDTVPASDWIERLLTYYDDPTIGGVGGRDVINGVHRQPIARRVGVLTWFGKLIGNHHLGCESVQEVDVLKGANASFRTQLVSFPNFFQGDGAEVHNEVYVCLRIRRMGYKLVYDPDIQVDHFPAPRFDVDQRDMVVPLAIRNATFNFIVTCFMFLPRSSLVSVLMYNILIGHKGGPGFLRFVLGLARKETDIISSYVPCQLGMWQAIHHYVRSRARDKWDSQRHKGDDSARLGPNLEDSKQLPEEVLAKIKHLNL